MTGGPVGPDIEGMIFVAHLGSGGYSEVYQYERISPRMKVAVKVLKDVDLSAAELRQFENEAQTMAQLADHPNIVQVFSTGTMVTGQPFLVMKYYPPPNLGVRAARNRMSVAEVLRTAVKISSAVETAHRAGILHRDIKPANILVSQYDEPGLTDFGIAGQAADSPSSDDPGVSVPWSPPEVLSGSSNGSPQSDVYSLAATIWTLLVGRSPFEMPGGDNSPRAVMGRILSLPPPSTGRADVPAPLERLLQNAMAKNPTARPRSALDFARSLQAVEQDQRFMPTNIVVDGTEHGSPAPPSRPGPDLDHTSAPAAPAAMPASSDGSQFAPDKLDTPAPTTDDARHQVPAAPPTVRRPLTPTADALGSRGPRGSSTKPVQSKPSVLPAFEAPSASPAGASSLPRPAEKSAGDPIRHRSHETFAEPTIRRPIKPSAPPDELPATGPGGIRKAYVVATIVTAAVLAIAAGIVLATRGSHHSNGGPSNGPSQVSTSDIEGPASLATPKFTGHRFIASAKVVRFTWTDSSSKQPDVKYLYEIGADPFATTSSPKLDVPVPGGTDPTSVCITVQAVDTSQHSDTAKACGVR